MLLHRKRNEKARKIFEGGGENAARTTNFRSVSQGKSRRKFAGGGAGRDTRALGK